MGVGNSRGIGEHFWSQEEQLGINQDD